MFRGDAAHSGTYHSAALEHFGGLQWRVQTGGMVHSSATLDDGALYIGSGDGRLYALDARTGEERWQFPTGRAISSTPAVAEGLVFVGSRDNAFWAVDARSGKQRWRLETGADKPLPWGFETGDLYTCDVVTCEALSLGDPPHRRRIRRLLNALEFVSTSPDAARWAAESRHRRHAEGGKLGLGDALIAAVAVSLGATVVTRNTRDFERQGLSVLSY